MLILRRIPIFPTTYLPWILRTVDTNDNADDHVFEASLIGPEDAYRPAGTPVDESIPVAKPEPVRPIGLRERIDQSSGLTWLLVIATGLGSLILFVVTSLAATIVAMLIVNDGSLPKAFDDSVITNLMQDRVGFTLSVMVPQASLVLLPVLACFLLPAGPRKSLRLVRGRWPIWGWVAAAVATPLIGTLASMAIGPFVEESATLEAMGDAFRHHANTGFLIPVALMIGITPSICEEILFRGFLQPRLTRLMPPIAGVFLASLGFAAMHLDPVHVLGVLPLGLWLGFLSYKSASLFPAMLGHFVNNTLSVVMVVPEDAGVLDAPDMTIGALIFGAGIVGIIGVVLANYRAGAEPADPLLASQSSE